MSLSEDEINKVHDALIDAGLTDARIRIDLLDHVCCLIEHRIEFGMDFKSSFQKAMEEFPGSELHHLQEESIYYLTLKQNKMKKLTGVLGIITSCFVIVGVFFKLMFWPGANIIMVTGLILTAIISLPLLARIGFPKTSDIGSRVTYLLGLFSAIILSISACFILMHWAGGYIMSAVGFIILCLGFIPLYMIRSYRTAENKLLSISKTLLILAGIAVFYGLMFRSNNAMSTQRNIKKSPAITAQSV